MSKFNILIVSVSFPPKVIGGGMRIYRFGKYLTGFGHTVHVITRKLGGDMTTFPLGKKFHVHRCSYGPFGLAFYYSSFVKIMQILKSEKIDILHLTHPPAVDLISGYLAKKFVNTPMVVEFRDPWVRSIKFPIKANRAFVPKNDIRWKLFNKIEGSILKSANKIVVSNPSIKKELASLYPSLRDRFEVIFNGADLKIFEKANYPKAPKYKIAFFGTIYLSRVLDVIIESIKYIKEEIPDIQLFLIGHGPHKEKLERLVKNLDLENNVVFVDVMPTKKLSTYTKDMDAFIVSISPENYFKYALPSKIFDAMAMGKPIIGIGARNSDLEMIIKKHNCGIFLTTTNARKVAKSIIKLFSSNLQQLGKNSRNAVEKYYNSELAAQKLIKVYEDVLADYHE